MKRPSSDLDILAAFLEEPERLALEADAGNDLERAQTIAESHRLKAALERGDSIEARDMDDLLLAFASLGDHSVSNTWRSRIAARLEENPAAAERRLELLAGLDRLEAGSDAAAHFARLTGHAAAPGPSRRGLWLAAASVVLLVLAHGIYGNVTEDPVRYAAWSQLDRPRPTRGSANAASDLRRANELALASRKTVFGLWPRYDEARLEEADALLTGRDDSLAVLLRGRIQQILAPGGQH